MKKQHKIAYFELIFANTGRLQIYTSKLLVNLPAGDEDQCNYARCDTCITLW